jgi:hypothetical protein
MTQLDDPVRHVPSTGSPGTCAWQPPRGRQNVPYAEPPEPGDLSATGPAVAMPSLPIVTNITVLRL